MRLILAAAAILAVAACGVDHGYVTSKRDVPAHEEHYLRSVYMGQSCTTSGSGKNKTQSCQSKYIYLPDTRDVSRACYVSLKNEKESGDREISCDAWDKTKVNDYVTLK